MNLLILLLNRNDYQLLKNDLKKIIVKGEILHFGTK